MVYNLWLSVNFGYGSQLHIFRNEVYKTQYSVTKNQLDFFVVFGEVFSEGIDSCFSMNFICDYIRESVCEFCFKCCSGAEVR